MPIVSRGIKVFATAVVVLGLPASAASQAVDTASAVRAIAAALLRENASGPRDHQGPFVLGVGKTEVWKPWVATLEAELRKTRPNALATPAANVLRVDVSPLITSGDTVFVGVTFSGCTPHGTAWTHDRTLRLTPDRTGWVTSWDPMVRLAHGPCRFQAPASFVGTWELQSVIMQTASDSAVPVWGEHPIGRLVYDAQGRMFALLMPEARNRAAGDRPIPEALVREAAGYYGSYTVDTARRVVTHHVRTSLRAAESGSIKRSYLLRGNALVLAAKAVRDGSPVTYVLTWKRLEP